MVHLMFFLGIQSQFYILNTDLLLTPSAIVYEYIITGEASTVNYFVISLAK